MLRSTKLPRVSWILFLTIYIFDILILFRGFTFIQGFIRVAGGPTFAAKFTYAEQLKKLMIVILITYSSVAKVRQITAGCVKVRMTKMLQHNAKYTKALTSSLQLCSSLSVMPQPVAYLKNRQGGGDNPKRAHNVI